MLDRSLFIFRRDLRLRDNTGLLKAMQMSKRVIPLFIIDPKLISRWHSATHRLAFLAEALANLDDCIARHGGNLVIREGDAPEVVSSLLATHRVDAVFINRDYTPFSIRRDQNIRSVCQQAGVRLYQYADQLLNDPELVKKADGQPYSVFTPYYRKARTFFVDPPALSDDFRFDNECATTGLQTSTFAEYLNANKEANPAAQSGPLPLLSRLKDLPEYSTSKDIPATPGTSKLSAHLRFGTCSVREVFHAASKHLVDPSDFQRQLYWRDFYSHIGYHYPHVFKGPFRRQLKNVEWDDNPEAFDLWCQGKTGFPIIDAGQRELLMTGNMHNRVRMVVASFLVKNLHIDWRLGERHFANLLIDFDPPSNNGNWQWCASTGCDAQPYFRVFNPWRQQKKFDPDCLYIKHWLPELATYSPRAIHALETKPTFYLPQIVDLKRSSAESKARFKAVAAS